MNQNQLVFKTKNKKQILGVQAWIDNSISQIVYGGAKGGGKSFLGASLIFSDALTYDGTHYFIARKELNDLRKYTIPTVHEVFEKWGIKLEDYGSFNGQDNCFKLNNGSKVFLIACKDEPGDPLFERFGSMQMTRGWIEEAGEITEDAKSNLYLSIGRWKNDVYGLKKKLLMTCNPKKGWLKRDYVDKSKAGTLPEDTVYIQAFSQDNVYLPADYIQTLSNEKDPIRRARLFEGNWDYDDNKNALLTDREISSIFTNDGVPGLRYMTIDPAFFGQDSAIIYIWNGFIVEHAYEIQQTDHSTFQTTVELYLAMHDIENKRTVSDATGEGSYIPSFIKGVRGFLGGASPIDDDNPTHENLKKRPFKNLRSQCIWEMAQYIKDGKVAFKVKNEKFINRLAEELAEWRVIETDEDKKIQIIPKSEIKEVIGRSTDHSDALYMRAFFELDHDSKRNANSAVSRRQEQVNNAQPFNRMGI